MSTYLITNKTTNSITIEGVSIAPGSSETVVFNGALPQYVQDLADNGFLGLTLRTDVTGVMLIDPATGLPYKAGESSGPGASVDVSALSKEATQLEVRTAVQNIDADLGAKADATATTDTGTFSIVSLLKRGLQRWTSLLDRLPASLGQKASAASLPVVLASDQTLPLPTSAATATLQTSGNTLLTSLDNKTPTLGQKNAAGSVPVVLASDVETPVKAVTRTCTGRQTIQLAAATVTSLTPPANSVACVIQADGNTVRVTLNASNPSATDGQRLDDGVFIYVDSVLASVRLFAVTACNVQVDYFDKA